MRRYLGGMAEVERDGDARSSSGDGSDRPWILGLIVVAAVALTVVGPGAPTGQVVADLLLRAGLSALVVLAASRARPWTVLVFVVPAALLATGATALVGLVAVLLAAAAVAGARVPSALPAASAAVGVVVATRLPPRGPFGLTAALMTAAVVPLLWTAYRSVSPPARRRTRRIALGVIVFVVLATGASALAAWRAQSDMRTGLDRTRAALADFEHGDPSAAAQFEAGASSFASARSAVSAPWVWPARLVPGLAQNITAATRLSQSGLEVTRAASAAAAQAPFDALQPQAGVIETARIDEVRPSVTALVGALRDADSVIGDVNSGWLLPPVQRRLANFGAELTDRLSAVEQAQAALEVGPDMLGAAGTRRYLVLFSTPAEARGLGGFAGAYGVIVADHGHLELATSGHTSDLNGPEQATPIPGSEAFQARYSVLSPQRFLGNVTASPDFPTVAAFASQVFPGAQDGFDGVIYADPYALAGLLRLTGPIDVGGAEGQLTADNLPDYLFTGQYARFGATSDRADMLAEVARATFDKALDSRLPEPRTVIDTLGPLISEGHLRFVSFDPRAGAVLARAGLTGAFPEQDGHDLVAPRSANVSTNKIDAHLWRTVDYDVAFDPATGQVDSTATITLDNRATTDLPSYVATNRDLNEGRTDPRPFASNTDDLTWYGPLPLVSAEVDGHTASVSAADELGWRAYGVRVTIPAGGRSVIVMHFSGTLPAGDRFGLTVAPQALVNADNVHIRVRSAVPDSEVVSAEGLGVVDGAAEGTFDDGERHVVEVGFGRGANPGGNR